MSLQQEYFSLDSVGYAKYENTRNASSKIRLQSGHFLQNCIRLLVQSPEGTFIEYYAEEKGLVRIEKQ